MTLTTLDSIQAIVFDWGDTLMKVFPQYSTIMLEWPEVAAVEGASEALLALSQQKKLVVATNAAASNAGQVMGALQRAGLSQWISQVYTYHELGSRKPSQNFYRALENQLGLHAGQLCMVGDEFLNDISGAKSAGWTAVWLNPSQKAAPGLLPVHNHEIKGLKELSEALSQPSLPDVSLCVSWLVQNGATHNLLQHVQSVAAVAYQMAIWLKRCGEPINPLLAHRGGLLHDIAKIAANRPQPEGTRRLSHGEMGGQILAALEQAELSRIAGTHQLFNIQSAHAPQTWEEKLVYFADKLVEGSRLVAVEERMAGLMRRYPSDQDIIHGYIPLLNQLQNDLCSHMGFPAEELLPRLKKAIYET